MTIIPPPTSSPWGKPDHHELLLPGAWWVSTPEHGGMMIHRSGWTHLSGQATEYGEAFARTWLCYEEDCDWAVPVWDWPALVEPMRRYGKRSALDMLARIFELASFYNPLYLLSVGVSPNPAAFERWVENNPKLANQASALMYQERLL